MSRYYPIMIDLSGKKVAVIGGGAVAARKIGSLLRAEADITVISPSVTSQIKQWANHNDIEWQPREFTGKQDIKDALLIIAATNHADLNREIRSMISPFQLLNIVDQPDLSSCIFPAFFTRGKLSISVSTSGANPGLSQKIRQELSQMYDESFEDYVDFLEECRAEVLKNIPNPQARSKVFKKLLDPVFLELTKNGDNQERKSLFLTIVSGLNL